MKKILSIVVLFASLPIKSMQNTTNTIGTIQITGFGKLFLTTREDEEKMHIVSQLTNSFWNIFSTRTIKT